MNKDFGKLVRVPLGNNQYCGLSTHSSECSGLVLSADGTEFCCFQRRNYFLLNLSLSSRIKEEDLLACNTEQCYYCVNQSTFSLPVVKVLDNTQRYTSKMANEYSRCTYLIFTMGVRQTS